VNNRIHSYARQNRTRQHDDLTSILLLLHPPINKVYKSVDAGWNKRPIKCTGFPNARLTESSLFIDCWNGFVGVGYNQRLPVGRDLSKGRGSSNRNSVKKLQTLINDFQCNFHFTVKNWRPIDSSASIWKVGFSHVTGFVQKLHNWATTASRTNSCFSLMARNASLTLKHCKGSVSWNAYMIIHLRRLC